MVIIIPQIILNGGIDMSDEVELRFDGVVCPICGGEIWGDHNGLKTTFRCLTPTANGGPCRGLACKCLGCDKVYPSTNFGLHGDVYECKTCGRVQWDYTEQMRFRNAIFSRSSSFPF